MLSGITSALARLVKTLADMCWPCFFLQAHFDEHLQDTEVDAPMANLHLHNLQVGPDSLCWQESVNS